MRSRSCRCIPPLTSLFWDDHQQPKPAISAAHSARITSFCPFAVASGPCHRLTAFSHWKPLLRSLKIFVWFWPIQSSERWSSGKLSLCWRGSAHPSGYICTMAWTAAQRILFILPVTAPPWWRQQARKKQSTIESPTLYIHTDRSKTQILAVTYRQKKSFIRLHLFLLLELSKHFIYCKIDWKYVSYMQNL